MAGRSKPVNKKKPSKADSVDSKQVSELFMKPPKRELNKDIISRLLSSEIKMKLEIRKVEALEGILKELKILNGSES